MSAPNSPHPLDWEGSVVSAYWRGRQQREEMTANSVARYQRVFASFIRYVAVSGLTSMLFVDPALCRDFIHAPLRGTTPPAPSTSRFRLTVVRDAYVAVASARGMD